MFYCSVLKSWNVNKCICIIFKFLEASTCHPFQTYIQNGRLYAVWCSYHKLLKWFPCPLIEMFISFTLDDLLLYVYLGYTIITNLVLCTLNQHQIILHLEWFWRTNECKFSKYFEKPALCFSYVKFHSNMCWLNVRCSILFDEFRARFAELFICVRDWVVCPYAVCPSPFIFLKYLIYSESRIPYYKKSRCEIPIFLAYQMKRMTYIIMMMIFRSMLIPTWPFVYEEVFLFFINIPILNVRLMVEWKVKDTDKNNKHQLKLLEKCQYQTILFVAMTLYHYLILFYYWWSLKGVPFTIRWTPFVFTIIIVYTYWVLRPRIFYVNVINLDRILRPFL